MAALCIMKHHSQMRTRNVCDVGVGYRGDFMTTNMEEELQFSPQNAFIVLPQWQSSSAGFTFTSPPFLSLTLSLSITLPSTCPTRNATLPLWRQFHSLLSVTKYITTAAIWRGSQVQADKPVHDFKFVMRPRESAQTLCSSWICYTKDTVNNIVCDMMILVTLLIIVTSSCEQLLISTVWSRLWSAYFS